MKKVILLSSVAALSLGMATAYAAPTLMNDGGSNGTGWYLGGGLGTNYLQNMYSYDGGPVAGTKTEYNWGWNGSLAVGYRMQNWRAEFQGGYVYNDMDGIYNSGAKVANGNDAKAWTYLVNGYYDINMGSQWVPYVGVGLGGMTLDFEGGSGHNKTTTNFAYQGILGLGYDINQNFRVYAEYRRLETPTIKVKYSGETFDTYYQGNLVNIGVNYFF